MNKKIKIYNHRYEKIAKIGEGTFGKVMLVVDMKFQPIPQKPLDQIEENKSNNNNNNQDILKAPVFAIKKSRTPKNQSLQRVQGVDFTFLREIKIMREIHYENIVELKDVFFEEDHVFLVMDYMSYNLKSLIQNHFQSLDLDDVKNILTQILKGVDVLHKSWIIHRDIAPANMLLNNKGILKISDMGLAKYYGSPDRKMTKNMVTLPYRAPEILFGSDLYAHKVDIWSIGCIMAELFYGFPIFPGASELDQLSKIFQITGTPDETNWPNCDKLPNFIQFKKCSSIAWKDLISDIPADAVDLLNKFLSLNPLKRPDAEEALNHPFFKNTPHRSECKFVELYKNSSEKVMLELIKNKANNKP